MKTLKISSLLFTLALSLNGEASPNMPVSITETQKPCIPLKDQSSWNLGVFEPGNYCVAQNLHQSSPWLLLPHQAAPSGSLLRVDSGNVVVDLMGHNLQSDISYGIGVYLYSGANDPDHLVQIRNGSIEMSKQLAIFMVHAPNEKNERFYHESLEAGVRSNAAKLASYDGDTSRYVSTEFVLQNLTLKSDYHVVLLQEKKNVIRNCRIIGGIGTINPYGPDLVFENNEIFLKATDPKTKDGEPPVALYLEDADNSIVRNNRFIIKGRVADTTAIVLKNSANVRIENNTITGATKDIKLLDTRSTTLEPATVGR